MDHHINPTKTAFTVGVFVGFVHLVWSALVVFGLAQPIVDFVLWMHMINVPYVVTAFDLSAAVTLIVVTTIMGYVFGYVFGKIWNRMHRG